MASSVLGLHEKTGLCGVAAPNVSDALLLRMNPIDALEQVESLMRPIFIRAFLDTLL